MAFSNNPIEIAFAIKDLLLSADPNVIDGGIGRNTVRQTPALQVIPATGNLRQLTAGGGISLVAPSYEAVYYRIYQPNKSDDEIKLGEALSNVIRLFEDPTTDKTLGGLVEMTSLTGYEFAELPQNRNGTAFKIVAIYLSAGEMQGSTGF